MNESGQARRGALHVRRLQGGHGWLVVREATASTEEERCAETLAHLLLDGLGSHGQLQVRTSERLFLGIRDDRGVLVGWASGMTPLAQRAAMLRAEAENTRSSLGVWDPEGGNTSGRHASRPEPREAAGPSRRGPVTTLPPAPMHTDSFEDDFLDYELVMEPRTEDASRDRRTGDEAGPSASRAAGWILEALSCTLPELGSAVAANYWRAALREASLDDLLKVSFRGEVDCTAPDTLLDEGNVAAMGRAVRMWAERCRPLIPDFDSLLQRLPEAPWHEPSLTRRG